MSYLHIYHTDIFNINIICKIYIDYVSLPTNYTQKIILLHFINCAQCIKYKLSIIVLIRVLLEHNKRDLKDTIHLRNRTINGLRPRCIRALDILILCLRPNKTRKILLYATLICLNDSPVYRLHKGAQ